MIEVQTTRKRDTSIILLSALCGMVAASAITVPLCLLLNNKSESETDLWNKCKKEVDGSYSHHMTFDEVMDYDFEANKEENFGPTNGTWNFSTDTSDAGILDDFNSAPGVGGGLSNKMLLNAVIFNMFHVIDLKANGTEVKEFNFGYDIKPVGTDGYFQLSQGYYLEVENEAVGSPSAFPVIADEHFSSQKNTLLNVHADDLNREWDGIFNMNCLSVVFYDEEYSSSIVSKDFMWFTAYQDGKEIYDRVEQEKENASSFILWFSPYDFENIDWNQA